MKSDVTNSKVKLAFMRAIESTFSKSDWIELALVTDTQATISGHGRLLRSLDFGDDDYGACIAQVLGEVLGESTRPSRNIYERFTNLREVEDFVNLESWLKRNDAPLFAQLYGDSEDDGIEAPSGLPASEQMNASTPRTPSPFTTAEPSRDAGLYKEGAPAELPMTEPRTVERKSRKVFLVHGRDHAARQDVVNLLHAFDLRVVDWSEALAATGVPNPYTLDVVNKGLELASSVVILLTPDDIGYVRPCFELPEDDSSETSPSGQARQNVIFEAGVALGRAPDRVVIVEVGIVRKMSDIAGVNIVRLRDSAESRRQFGRRLESAGLEVDMQGDSWMSIGSFGREQISKDDLRR